MKVDCSIINPIHLDPGYALLSVQNCFTSMEMFKMLDVHRSERLNDVQFMLLMRNITDLSGYEIEVVFNLLDIDKSGEIEFDEFYLIFCILIANKDAYEKELIYRHSKTIYQLIDSDGSGEISIDEFAHMGILFNFDHGAIKRIFDEFDVSGDKSLDFSEFRLFTMACIDEARAQAARTKVQAYENFHTRLLQALEPILRKFIRSDNLPVPKDIEKTTNKVRLPYARGKRNWKWTNPFHKSYMIAQRFVERRELFRTYIQKLVGNKPCIFTMLRLVCCDFCCLHHEEDQRYCSLEQWKCKCKCWKCFSHWIIQLLGCCRCCCYCCPCRAKHLDLDSESKGRRQRFFSNTSERNSMESKYVDAEEQMKKIIEHRKASIFSENRRSLKESKKRSTSYEY